MYIECQNNTTITMITDLEHLTDTFKKYNLPIYIKLNSNQI